MKTPMLYLRLVVCLAGAIGYWLFTNFLGAMLGGAGHGFLLFYQLSLFPFGAGVVAYAIAGLLLGLNDSASRRAVLIAMCVVQDAYAIYLLGSGSVSWSSAVQAWEAIPGVFVANILCFALGQMGLIWCLLKFRSTKAKAGSPNSGDETAPAT